MNIHASKRAGEAAIDLSFVGRGEHDENFLKVLAQTVVEGGVIQLRTKDDERAVLRWDGIEGARLNRGDGG